MPPLAKLKSICPDTDAFSVAGEPSTERIMQSASISTVCSPILYSRPAGWPSSAIANVIPAATMAAISKVFFIILPLAQRKLLESDQDTSLRFYTSVEKPFTAMLFYDDAISMDSPIDTFIDEDEDEVNHHISDED